MSRHRSPGGRRAHQGPPLLALSAAAGAGAHRSFVLPVGPLRARVLAIVATAVAGGALAVAGQAAYSGVPNGVNLLGRSAEELSGTFVPGDAAGTGADLARLAALPTAAAVAPAAVPASGPAMPDPQSLRTTADLHGEAVQMPAKAGHVAPAPVRVSRHQVRDRPTGATPAPRGDHPARG